jgi:hypothetical protein
MRRQAGSLLPKAKAISASTLLDAIKLRHSTDLVIPECKNGPTQMGSHRRFDAWVLVRTWSPITMIGYEIKVSRSDWRRDEKLADYQGLCHQLYIVAPKGVVPVEELPESVGLIEAVGDGSRLVTRRKASRREIPLPGELLVYILMARVAPKQEDDGDWASPERRREHNRQQLEQWAKTKSDRRELSYLLSEKIREQFHAQEKAIAAAEERNKELAGIRARIVELGFNPDESLSAWRVSSRLSEMAGKVGGNLPRLLATTIREMQSAHDAIEELVNRAAKSAAVGADTAA